jgi:serine phosphatase RsbU (regulator of sigma subunit)
VGETECGDKAVTVGFDSGALVAVIDALGHGPDAAAAAAAAATVLEQYAHEPPATLIERCHESLVGKRGAAISVASIDFHRQTMTWLGVGNVTGVLMYADHNIRPRLRPLLVRSGVVGDRLPDLRASMEPVSRGDMLIFATDGVRPDFSGTLPLSMPPQRLANRLLGDYATDTDDATVLVFRINGET